jgi:uncharacterized protein YqgV (UPF0045/DUF77 family)
VDGTVWRLLVRFNSRSLERLLEANPLDAPPTPTEGGRKMSDLIHKAINNLESEGWEDEAIAVETLMQKEKRLRELLTAFVNAYDALRKELIT